MQITYSHHSFYKALMVFQITPITCGKSPAELYLNTMKLMKRKGHMYLNMVEGQNQKSLQTMMRYNFRI